MTTTPDPDRAAGIAAIEAILDAFPDIGPRKGRRIGIHPKVKPAFAEELYDKGLRMHPELAVLFAIPGTQRGAMPYTNLPDWVDRDKYTEYLAANPSAAVATGTTERATLEQLRAVHAALNPERAQEIAAMSPAELATANAEYAAKVPPALEKLAKLADRNARMQRSALRNARTEGGAQQ